ncbi:hypothetical protein JDV02_002050 [Purpureocillium takamizusanense]|uniref:Uncharacterized protein n=1 Tax=Purpureocillium takamizusanense TaxID=2060973 RepID=A0A9Q8QAK4_9HYPO|nr:uncharacterized protein JDV02_002050 [Purpureocillium takamizusanense]UNI15524.1 hypothetical protein JDV02_002050 [Purpureocillium takamizusanense]
MSRLAIAAAVAAAVLCNGPFAAAAAVDSPPPAAAAVTTTTPATKTADASCPTVTTVLSVCSTCFRIQCQTQSTISSMDGCAWPPVTKTTRYPCEGTCPGGCAGTDYITVTGTPSAAAGACK